MLFRGMRPSQVAALIAWCLASAGFVIYLVSTDSFRDAYGSITTGVVLLVWLTLFSLLRYATPDLRVSDAHALPSRSDRRSPTRSIWWWPRPRRFATRRRRAG